MATKKALVVGSTGVIEELQAGDVLDPSSVAQEGYVADTPAGSIAAYKAVYLTSAGVIGLADQTDAAKMPVMGMTLEATPTSSTTSLATEGTVTNGSWTWTPRAPLFVSTSGNLTETPPSSGYLQRVATAISATKILLELGEMVKRG